MQVARVEVEYLCQWLIGSGGGCSCKLLAHPTPMFLPKIVLTCATCAGGVFPSINWRKYSTCTHATCTVWWWLCGGLYIIYVVVVITMWW